MRLRILLLAYALLAFLFGIRLTQSTRPMRANEARAEEPRAQNSAAKRVETPEMPRVQLQPWLLLIEPDWSTSPTAAEVKADLEKGLAGASLPKNLREDLLKSGPRILFAESNAECYRPESCAEFMAWLEKHKLIRKKVSFPEAILTSTPPSNEPAGYQSTLADAELLPVPKDEGSDSRPFVDVRERRKWQVFVTASATEVDLFAGIERIPVELGRPNDAWVEHSQVIGRICGRRAGESLFISGAPGGNAYELAARAAPIDDVPKTPDPLPVIWVQAIEVLTEKAASPRLHIPDRLERPQLFLSDRFPPREPYVRGKAALNSVTLAESWEPANASTSVVPRTRLAPGTAPPVGPPARPEPTIGVNPDEGLMGAIAVVPRKDSEGLRVLRNEFQQLDARATSLAEEIRTAIRNREPVIDPSRRDALRSAVNQAFVAGQKLHEAELAEFRERMRQLQKTIDRRSNNSEKIVNRRVEELLDPSLNWNEQELLDNTASPGQVPSLETPDEGAMIAPPEKSDQRPFRESITVGVISEVRDEKTVVISCKEPGEIRVGEKLVLSSPDPEVAGQSTQYGWIKILKLEDPETAIGKPFKLTRMQLENRFVDWKPKPGDTVNRPKYESTTSRLGTVPPHSGPASPRTAIDGVWLLQQGAPTLGPYRAVFWKDWCAAFAGDERIKLHRVTLDLSRTPHQLKLRNASTGENHHGIFEIVDDQLRMTVVPESEPFPAEFKHPLQEFTRASRDIPQKLLDAMAVPKEAPAAQFRRPFPTTVMAGSIVEVRDDGTLIISWKKPGKTHVGEELVLSSPDLEEDAPGRYHRIGWVRITNVVDDATAIGTPFEMGRRQLANRFVDWQPKPGDSVDRPDYDNSPTVDESDEPPADSAKPTTAVDGNDFNPLVNPHTQRPTAKPGPEKLRRRPIPLSSDVGLVSDIRDDGTVVVSCKEAGDVQVGEELILSWISKEGGGIFKPAGWITIIRMDSPDTAIGKPFELPRVQMENRFVDRLPKVGDFVGRPIYEKQSAVPAGGN